MRYRSLADLHRDVAHSLHKIPRDVDVIVGIPRSGLLVATPIALQFNKPLADLDGFINGRFLGSGKTKPTTHHCKRASDARRVALVDDSINTGNAINDARDALSRAYPKLDVVTFAAYIIPEAQRLADAYGDIVAWPRIFEWNMMHHAFLRDACVDIDGVLCVDPVEEVNDDGERYRHFLSNASPLFLPTVRVGHIVTSRLEKYRSETECWLKRNGVEYGRLHMLDLPDAATRRSLKVHSPFKADVYRETETSLFIESNPVQAEAIAKLSGQPVICVENGQLYTAPPLSAGAITYQAARLFKALRKNGGRIRRLARSCVGQR